MGEGFGTKFPEVATKGAIYVRVDILPNRVYKFDGTTWIEVKKQQSDTYLHNAEYIKHLVEKIEKGEYDIELLSETEKEEIAQYLKKLDN
jgi:3-methyladenine DNA glycosylase/8-oxoguanine DNA glycosylase